MRRRSVTILDLSEIEDFLNDSEIAANDEGGEPRKTDQKSFEGERESMFGYTRPKRSKTVYSPPVSSRTSQIEQMKWAGSGRVAVTLAPEEAEMWQENEMGIVIKAISSAILSKDIREQPRIEVLKKNLLDLEKEEMMEDKITNIEENCYIPDLLFEASDDEKRKDVDKGSLSPERTLEFIRSGGSKSTNVSEDYQFGDTIKFSQNEEIKIQAILSQNTRSYDVQISILVMGDARTGKTSLMNKFIENKFLPITPETFGMDYKARELEHKEKKIRFKIWDTNSEKKKENVLKAYYSLNDAIIIMYDVTNRESFEGAKFWYQSIIEELSREEDFNLGSPSLSIRSNSTYKKSPIIVLLGNKIDLKRERIVTKEMGKGMSKMHSELQVQELSVKKSKDLDKLFISLGQLILEKRESPNNPVGKLLENLESDEESENLYEGEESGARSIDNGKHQNRLKNKRKKKRANNVESQACKCLIF